MKSSPRCLIGYDYNLAWTGNRVDSDDAEEEPLGGGDVLIAVPVILSTRGIVAVPNASAAIACAPPTA